MQQSRQSRDWGRHPAAPHIWGISGGQRGRVDAVSLRALGRMRVCIALCSLCQFLRDKHTLDRSFFLFLYIYLLYCAGDRGQKLGAAAQLRSTEQTLSRFLS